MNLQIMPSQALSFGSEQAYYDAWGAAVGDIAYGRTPEGKFARGVITAYWLALPIGSAYRATAGVRGAMTWMRHPVAKYLAVYRSSTALGRGAKVYLQASKGLRYANYVAFAMNPLATYHYYKNGEYDKAMIQYFGPVGSVWVYNKYTESQRGAARPVKKPIRSKDSGRKAGKMPEKQRMRLWRMGLRWCKKHKRYDRCNLRGR